MTSHSASRYLRPIPARAGVGLKPEHYRSILDTNPDIGFFEIHAENYMGAGGPPHRYLGEIRKRYPLSLHGVGLSIGGEGDLEWFGWFFDQGFMPWEEEMRQIELFAEHIIPAFR